MKSTQVRFALSSSPVFSRTDTVTDSERFYSSVLDLFDDTEEKVEVNDLILWWNRRVSDVSIYHTSCSPQIITDKSFRAILRPAAQSVRVVHWLGSRRSAWSREHSLICRMTLEKIKAHIM